MKKSKLKTILILLIIIVLCLSVGVYAGYTLSATEVTYTKTDGITVSVKTALDELYAIEKLNETEKAVGDEVTVGGEQFYVLEWIRGSNVATLIAKYNLNTAGTAQQNASLSTISCYFSSRNYWSSSFTSSPFNLNDFYGYTSTDAIGKAKSYGISKGAVSSRLLSYEEANALKAKASSNEKIATMLFGKDSYNGGLGYWLGSAKDGDNVWGISSSVMDLSFCSYDFKYGSWGVRPVITALKSNIS